MITVYEILIFIYVIEIRYYNSINSVNSVKFIKLVPTNPLYVFDFSLLDFLIFCRLEHLFKLNYNRSDSTAMKYSYVQNSDMTKFKGSSGITKGKSREACISIRPLGCAVRHFSLGSLQISDIRFNLIFKSQLSGIEYFGHH